jgi:hypothetical protein
VKTPGVGEKVGEAATGGGGGGVVPPPEPLPELQPISVRRATLKLRASLGMQTMSFDAANFGRRFPARSRLRHGEV